MLAREAADALGLPVTVHRCGLITAHTACVPLSPARLQAACVRACMHARTNPGPPWVVTPACAWVTPPQSPLTTTKPCTYASGGVLFVGVSACISCHGCRYAHSFPACTGEAGVHTPLQGASAGPLLLCFVLNRLVDLWCRGLGQVNPTDLFTRLLAGVIYTGLAPASFYENPRSPRAHFDGM